MEEGLKEVGIKILLRVGLVEVLPAVKQVMGVTGEEAVLLEEREYNEAPEEELSELDAQVFGREALNMRQEGVLLGGEAREKAPGAEPRFLRWNRALDLR